MPYLYLISFSLLCNNSMIFLSIIVMLFCGELEVVRTY